MDTLTAYLPQDRLRALVRGESLPDRTHGAALFADISGFTPLTEKLREELGPRRGAEELTKRLEAVFSALLAEVEKYGGSVIGFAGDAMTCWFNDNDEGRMMKDEGSSSFITHHSSFSAVACALALQTAMRAFPHLALKVAVATGPARRLVVGDPNLQSFDVLAGETLTRMAQGEHLARKGDVIVDDATAHALGEALTISEWRATDQARFAVVTALVGLPPALSAPPPVPLTLDPLRTWVPSWVYERERLGQGAFLNEFRAVTFVFVRFTGIDYDSDSAPAQLGAYLQWVQAVVHQAEGYLRAPVMGDKGSYLLIAFGAPVAHEDDARRAVRVALTLRAPPAEYAFITDTQLGLSTGMVWAGLVGGSTRQAYDFMGDEVNLAARLMQSATPGEILVAGRVQAETNQHFVFETGLPLVVKGKTGKIPVFLVVEAYQRRAMRLQEPTYALPMVGRQTELQRIGEKLDLAAAGTGQVVAIVAEAGVGKSRLVAEVIRLARRKGFVGYGSACQSDGIHTPYLAWKSVWQAFFDVDPTQSLQKQIRNLESDIEDRAPARVRAMPLLSVLLDLNIPDNDFTRNLEPKIRQSALHALLEDCLKVAAQDEPILIVVEDQHWIDALSHDLLEQLAQALAHYAVCFVMAHRPPQLAWLQAPRLEVLPQFTRIELHELTRVEAEHVIRAKLAQLYPERSERGGALPGGLVDALMARAQGNPFYLEELLNYVHDRSIDLWGLQDPTGLLDLPDSLHTLILSRLDQLSEQEKTILRVASIVGRLFRAAWLTGYYPTLGAPPQVKTMLDDLHTLDITPLDSSEPELAYLFKHIVTHEVTYESLPFATRANLHEQLARYLETAVETGHAPSLPLDTIAFHYGRSTNTAKQREYLHKAGEAAQKNFAHDAALAHYGQLLPLLTEATAQTQIHLQRGQVWEVMGKWAEAEADYHAALDLSQEDLALKANAQFALGKLCRLRGDYAPALDWLTQAQTARAELEDTAGLAQVLIERGTVLWRQGDYAPARAVDRRVGIDARSGRQSQHCAGAQQFGECGG